ncbi:MBL fold metallo-hydrolase [Dehalobacterium formicoaceticum]|uniref:MBL fold metallo-hydrolase n=1 Tax=Dehalobacterium formicoaceticum TaxID=51515 RepID=UPI000B7F6F93|nr:MBL fold metallo-hydrolase [Dehalobacterium formicoaceticum]
MICQITYVANAGVLLDFQGQQILIDGLCSADIAPFHGLPEPIRKKIMESIPPYHNIQLLLFTHHHGDHFDASSTVQFLEKHPQACVIGSQETIDQIVHLEAKLISRSFSQESAPRQRNRCFQSRDLAVHLCPMVHMGRDYEKVDHLAYLIEGMGKKILHVGDANPVSENFEHLYLLESSVDLLIAPFPYLTRPSARQVIENYIRPKQIAALHLPRRERDDERWIAATMKSYHRVQDHFIPTVFFKETGESIKIS